MPTPRSPLPLLSKTRFTAGLQCLKRLYLGCYEPDLAPPPDEAQQALFDTGTAVGEVAQRLYPDGVLVDDDYLHHTDAVTRTTGLMADADVPAIFEAAFTQDDIRVRADILVRDGDGWALIEVKSSSSVKPQYIDDVAIQLWALERAGLNLRRVSVAHINTRHVYPGGEYDPWALFSTVDVTAEARRRLATIPDELTAMRLALSEDPAPEVDVGPHCSKPYDCEFIPYCHRDAPEWPVSELPGIRPARVQALREDGMRSILDLPASVSLNDLQRRVRDAIHSGQPWMSAELRAALDAIRPPAHFIDFETAGPALPVYPGTRPFEALAFQWSDHVLHEDGHLTHAEFLADGTDDPREEFATSLVKHLEGTETLVVYSNYEATQLRHLAVQLPALSSGIEEVLDRHRVDLLQVVRTHYYHPGFRGSFSLKSVLPALVPGKDYADLDIRDGGAAARAFMAMRAPGVPTEERARIRNALLAYCEQDTKAMVEIVRALLALGGALGGAPGGAPGGALGGALDGRHAPSDPT